MPIAKYIEHAKSNMVSEFGSFDSSAMDRNIIQPPYGTGECYLALIDTANADDVELAYELATPIVIDVSALSVDTIVGVNNIVSDCGGDVSIEYYTGPAKDIKDFISDGVEVGDLANVEITTPTNNQVLKYDSTANKWVNGEGGGSSGDHITLTQAEYDALVQAGAVDPNAFYFISDGSPNTYTAKQLFFDDAYYSTSQIGTTIALSESMANFDMIAVRGGCIATDNILKDTSTRFILKSEIEDLINNYPNKTWVCSFFQHATYGVSAVLRFPGFNQIFISDIAQPGYSGTMGRVVEVTGIRFDSFGGGTHQYSTEEQVVGKWIDGSTLYERTLVLRDNGVDKYTFTGNMEAGGFYAVGLTGIDKIWLDGLYSKRSKSGDTVYTDIDNNSTEVVTVFKHTDGSFYFKDIHAPVDIILIIRYTKSSS